MVLSPTMSASVPFMVDGNPSPTSQVERVGDTAPVPNSISISGNTVEIRNPGMDDGGMYRFIATNAAGTGMIDFFVVVQCKCASGCRVYCSRYLISKRL